MKKIDTSKSLIFSREVDDLKKSLEYLNQYGYFSNSKDFSEYEEGNLDGVHASNFMFRPYELTCNDDNSFFSHFIPKLKAVFIEEEPKKKKLRPFRSVEEFFAVTGFKIGDIVKIEGFDNYIYEETTILNGVRVYMDDGFHRKDVMLGSNSHSLDNLFKHFKYYKNSKWFRFGVEE